MRTLQVFTIQELLLTPTIKYNQTTLANLLHINRSTLRKYMDDITNARHSVLFIDGRYSFMSIPNEKTNRRT